MPRLVAILRAAACVIAVAMLLAFPAYKSHQFENHFRSPELRRWVERHTFFAQPEITGAEQTAHADVAPPVLVPVATPDFSKPLANFAIASNPPLTRYLLRLKLGPSRSGESDPLS
jgi:hypothetical protein